MTLMAIMDEAQQSVWDGRPGSICFFSEGPQQNELMSELYRFLLDFTVLHFGGELEEIDYLNQITLNIE